MKDVVQKLFLINEISLRSSYSRFFLKQTSHFLLSLSLLELETFALCQGLLLICQSSPLFLQWYSASAVGGAFYWADSPRSIWVSTGVHGVNFFVLSAGCRRQTRGMPEFDHHFGAKRNPFLREEILYAASRNTFGLLRVVGHVLLPFLLLG